MTPDLRSVLAANTDLCQLVAAAADLCRKPLRHGVHRLSSDHGDDGQDADALDCRLRLEARGPDGGRLPMEDLDLEIFPSGADLHFTLAWCWADDRPLLWQGSHPVWMDGMTGERCGRPSQADSLEGLARRLRILLVASD
ncbi:MAG: hypothetical protein VKK97_09445 [Synechococcaceae cyanobacterium]|jgi:hypothetical protein|nr:hypothetical protein [Synechococcaceae cyanobacterium]